MFWSARQTLKKMAEKAGYSVHRATPLTHGHQRVYPTATYAPWSVDNDFQLSYDRVRFHTLVDKYRLWELWKFVEQAAKLSCGDCLEVGVWRGGSGCLIARKVQLLNMSSQVFLCDTFTGVVKAGPMDDVYKGGEHADSTESSVRALAEGMGVAVEVLKGTFPDDTGDKVESRTFRFCHIDVDVYQSARETTEWIWPRMVSGGVIVFDDYGSPGCDGIRKFLDEWQSKPECTFMHNLNGHAVLVKL